MRSGFVIRCCADWVAGAPVATKLSGNLTSRQMEQDGYIAWSPYRGQRQTLYTNHAAVIAAINVGVSLAVLGIILLVFQPWTQFPFGQEIHRLSSCTAIIAVVFASATWFFLPKTPAFVVRRPAFLTSMLYNSEIPLVLNDEMSKMDQQSGGKFQPDAAWVRRQFSETSELRTNELASCQTNSFSGQPWHEEDSPGNFILRQTAEGIEYSRVIATLTAANMWCRSIRQRSRIR